LLDNAPAQREVIEFVEACPAPLIFFAIGSPQSELICAQIAQRGIARGVALCFGASLEFVTGAKLRAPKALQKTGLEWLFRLATEPRRLWRRYLVEGPTVFLIWLRWLLSAPR
jgi:N-acetylglucosaminyldiphosphoundecaprenol N-acetyl-beta-D-mannosaminyltransferase